MATITGNFTEVNAALARVALKVDAAGEPVEEAGAQIVAQLAQANAPRLTGHLAASVDGESGLVIANTPYAGYQEYGTRHNAAQPFMRPAKDAAEIPWRRTAEGLYTIATR